MGTVPDDITDGAAVEQIFKEFLEECNITSEQTLPDVQSYQEELTLDEREVSGNQGVY